MNFTGVSKITNFCTKHAKYVHTEKFVKVQCTSQTLITVPKLSVEHVTPSRNGDLADAAEVELWRWRAS